MENNSDYSNMVYLDNNSIGLKYSSANFIAAATIIFFTSYLFISELPISRICLIALVYSIFVIILYKIRQHKMKNLYAYILTDDLFIINKLRILSTTTKTIPLVDIISIDTSTINSEALVIIYLKNNKRKKMRLTNLSDVPDKDLIDLINTKKYSSH